jgi:hypothetical protein
MRRGDRWSDNSWSGLLAAVLAIAGVGCGGGGSGTPGGSGPLTCKISVTGDSDSGIGSRSYESTETVPYDPFNVALAAATAPDPTKSDTSVLCMHTENGDGGMEQLTWSFIVTGPVAPLQASESTTNYKFFDVSYTSPEAGYVCGRTVDGNGQMGVQGTFALMISSVSAYGPTSATRYAIKASGHAVCPGPKGSVAIDVTLF